MYPNGYVGRQQGNLAGGNYNDVVNLSKKLGIPPEKILELAKNQSRDEYTFQQGIGQENLGFSRGLNADQMRQSQYNQMAGNEQQNRQATAMGLLNDYASARNAAGQLMASTLRF